MTTTKSGSFHARAKVFSQSDLNKIIGIVEELILDAFDKIEEGVFTVNPKSLSGKDASCTFCPYSNICYKKYQDTVVLEPKKFTENVEE